MENIAISAAGIGKRYRLGQRSPYHTLRTTIMETLQRPFRASRPRPDVDESPEILWALKDISFEVPEGQVVGLIGRNGAGKSTLLKLLSRISAPTEGRIEIRGRLGSLLEVGTGFHPEMSGRENVFLSGAILGMRKHEIVRRFDSIVDFSGVEKFIDTPLKHYSSGMHMRLAFSVAAHLDPEILLVDEVLAVGDAEFQKKCLDKMRDVTRAGRTILFVSHNLAAIQGLCERTIWLESGRVARDGPSERVIAEYLDRNVSRNPVVKEEELQTRANSWFSGQPHYRCRNLSILNDQGQPQSEFSSDEEITIELTYECLRPTPNTNLLLLLQGEDPMPILRAELRDDSNFQPGTFLEPGVYVARCVLPPGLFGECSLYLTLWVVSQNIHHVNFDRILRFNVRFVGYNQNFSPYSGGAYFRPRLAWRHSLMKAGEFSSSEPG